MAYHFEIKDPWSTHDERHQLTSQQYQIKFQYLVYFCSLGGNTQVQRLKFFTLFVYI